jgi:SPP1 gp7 family putative phage head morphogenesis protein
MSPTKAPPEFGPTKRLQRAFEQGIKAISQRVLTPKLPGQTFAQWLTELARRSQNPDIQTASNILAKRMINQVHIKNARTWREAASRTTKSQLLYKALVNEMQGATGARVQSLVRENASLISSLSLHAAQTLTHEIQQAAASGARPKTIAKMAQKRFPELLRSRTHLISRTETAKASTALTEARCERLNIQWYIWESSKDQRTRASHKAMHGVVVPWSQAPSPESLVGLPSQGNYHAGEIYNCRCLVIPILTLDDIQFPARVYWRGSITTMTKQQFKVIAVGLEGRAA